MRKEKGIITQKKKAFLLQAELLLAVHDWLLILSSGREFIITPLVIRMSAFLLALQMIVKQYWF